MRGAAVLLLLLLAGCAAPAEPVAAPIPLGDAMVAGTQEVRGALDSNVAVCTALACAGSWGPDTWTADEGHTWVALDLTVRPDGGDPVTDTTAPLTDVRVVAECVGERASCPAEPLAVAEGGPGDFPLRLVAEGFRVAEPNLLALRLESSGPAPGQGSGARYLVEGTLSFLDPPGSADEADEQA